MRLLLAIPMLLAPACAFAQEDIPDGRTLVTDEEIEPRGGFIDLALPPTAITVIARGIETTVESAIQPITIIGSQEIEAVQGADLTRVLTRARGVTLTRNGGVGGFTGVRVRGGDAEDLLVLVDGVRVADVAAPSVGFDFGNVLAGEIEKIELLRGPNSVVWGSDAIAGVMNLTTRVANGVRASAEYGSDETLYATLGGGLYRDRVEAGLTGSFYRTDGFSAAANGIEDDGFERWQVAGRGSVEPVENLWLTANGRYAEGELDIDGFPAPAFTLADTAETQDTRDWSGRIGARYRAYGLRLDGGFAMADTRREYVDPAFGNAPYYTTEGRSKRAELFGRTFLGAPEFAIDFGASREWTRFDDSGTDRKATITGLHVMPGWYGHRLSVAAGVRYDDHSIFGDAWTVGANAAYAIVPDLKLRAGYGEGFKAPSLFQSASSLYGNAALDPETSRAWDLGLTYDRVRYGAGLSLFRRDSRNLVDFVSCGAQFDCARYPFGTYDNVGRARAQGFELDGRAAIGDRLTARAAYSYVETEDRSEGGFAQGNDLARRPRHALTTSLDWRGFGEATIGGDVRLVGDSFDDRGNNVPLDGYYTVDIRASVPLGALELFGRVENLTDEDYRTVAGYATQGRSAFAGVRVRLAP